MSTTSQPEQAPAPRPRRWLPSFGLVAAAVSLVGFGGVCFLAGGATIYFQFPLAAPLAQAFAGANQAVFGLPSPVSAPEAVDLLVLLDAPEKTCDGLTLLTTTEGPVCRLLNMEGREAHRWVAPDESAWRTVLGAKAPPSGSQIHWEQCHALPNGDLVGLCCSGGDTPYGFALVKLDRESKILWALPGTFHHDLTVDEHGRAYAVEDALGGDAHPLPGLSSPTRSDRLIVVSPDGETEMSVPITEAFQKGPYLTALLSGDVVQGQHSPRPGPGAGAAPQGQPGPPPPPGGLPGAAPPPPRPNHVMPGDVLHTNSIHVLGRRAAAKSPLFRAGQVLLSLRSPSLLAVVDVQKRSVVWAARGPWHLQHSAELLDSGRILLFDNMGDPNRSRVLEYDPRTQAVPWSYSGEKEGPFQVPFRGRCQRLPNGNTLVVSPQYHVLEASPRGETVWKLAYPPSSIHSARNITGARRYQAGSLAFLENGGVARSK